MIKRVYKTAAVKAGQSLTREEMEAMIPQLEACEVPHTCPRAADADSLVGSVAGAAVWPDVG